MMKQVYDVGDRVEVTLKYHDMTLKSRGVVASCMRDVYVVLDEPKVLDPPAHLDFIPTNIYRIDRSHIFIRDKIPKSSMKKLTSNQDTLTPTSYVICGRCKEPVRYSVTFKCPYHHTTCLSHVLPWNNHTNSPDINAAAPLINYLKLQFPNAGYDECVTRGLAHYHRTTKFGYSAALDDKCEVECTGCAGRHMLSLQYMHREIARCLNASKNPNLDPIVQNKAAQIDYPAQHHESKNNNNMVYQQLLNRGCSQMEIAEAMSGMSMGEPVDVDLLHAVIISKRSEEKPKRESSAVSSHYAQSPGYLNDIAYQSMKREAYEISSKRVRVIVWDLLTSKRLPVMLEPQRDIRTQMKTTLNQLIDDDDIWLYRIDDDKKGYCVRILPSTSNDGLEGIFPDDLGNNDVVLFRRRAENVSTKCYFETYAVQVKHNQSLCGKIVRMAETCFGAWRGVRGDGNCYYRSIYFGFLEQLVTMQPRSVEHFDEFIATMSTVHYASVAENRQHAAVMTMLRDARDGKIWRTAWELESTVLDISTEFDLAMIRACRRLIADYLIMYSDMEINGISIMGMLSGYDDNIKSMKQYCDESVCQMGVDAEGPLVELGILFRIFKCNGCVVLVDRSDDSRVMLCRTESGRAGASLSATIYVMLRPGHYDLLYPRSDITAQKLADLECAAVENDASEKDDSKPQSARVENIDGKSVRMRVCSYFDAVRGADITFHGEVNDDTLTSLQNHLSSIYMTHHGSLHDICKKISSAFRIPGDRAITLVTDLTDCWSIGRDSAISQRTLHQVCDDDTVYVKVSGIVTTILRLEYEDNVAEAQDCLVTLDTRKFETVMDLDNRLLNYIDAGDMHLRSVLGDVDLLETQNPWRILVGAKTFDFVLPFPMSVFKDGLAFVTPQTHTHFTACCTSDDKAVVDAIAALIGAENVDFQFNVTEGNVHFCRYDRRILSSDQRKMALSSLEEGNTIVIAAQNIECTNIQFDGDSFTEKMPANTCLVINLASVRTIDQVLRHVRATFHIPERFALSTDIATVDLIGAAPLLTVHVQTMFDMYCNGDKHHLKMKLSSFRSYDDLLVGIQNMLRLPKLTSLHSYIGERHDRKLQSIPDVSHALCMNAILSVAQCMCEDCDHTNDTIICLYNCGHYVCHSCVNKGLLKYIATTHGVPVAKEATAQVMSKLYSVDANMFPVFDCGVCPCINCGVALVSEDLSTFDWVDDAYVLALNAAEEAAVRSHRIRRCCLYDTLYCADSDVDEMMQLGCGHFYHPDCLSQYLKGYKDQLLGRGEKFMCLYCKDNNILCNCPGCVGMDDVQPHHINQFDLMSLAQMCEDFTNQDVDSLTSAMYRQHHDQNRLHGNIKYIECCEMLYEVDANHRRGTMHCTLCQTEYCTKCCRQAHPDLDCDEARRRFDEEEGLQVAAEAGIVMQACPVCETLATKDNNCYHVTCINCHTDFCFLCAAPREPTLAHRTNAYHRPTCEFAFENICCDNKCKTEKGLKSCQSSRFDPDNCSECRRHNKLCEFPTDPAAGSRCKVLIRADVDAKLV